ncbi:MBL fold metallo-hydrolase [Candidatus Methylobacter oryzae]|uniref:MBL fold metallo-hydrolase n=1 Tax=Candidatus Methylobacter oryzae TaxID=2497749 RepID=A0ABY3C7I3_9GAMM|nr:MBL fold metallo-hydrolase [Candidatus Methylobacter oryzae]TRW89523.1 MBL fold metallo-hydrolase [Candidatus Methylobacter oryzae]
MRFCIIPVTSYRQNCSLLICEQSNKAAIVDPGGDIDAIIKTINKENVSPESILITHGHLDHVGATAELAALLSVPVIGPHRDDQFLIDAIPEQCKAFRFPACDSFTPSRWLNQGDIVKVGAEVLDVFHCPGHTPGHVVYVHRNTKLAIVGDVLFKGSIGRTDLPKGNFNTLINSIKNNLWPLGEQFSFISGHGPMSTFGEEMRSNPFVGV